MQSLNENGVSITRTPGEEKFVKCRLSAFKRQTFYQYDYRHTDGELFCRKTGCKLINDRRLYFIMLARRQFKLHIFNNNRHHSIPIFLNSLILSLYLLSLNRTNPNSYFFADTASAFSAYPWQYRYNSNFSYPYLYSYFFSCHQFD